MARPKKLPDEKRYKWAVLNVTPTERAAIERAAGEAGQGVNAFILSCVRTARPVQMGHWRQMVQELVRCNVMLERVAVAAEHSSKPLDALGIQLSLGAIERQILGLTMPWLEANGSEVEEPEL